jgi:hypothetical protein
MSEFLRQLSRFELGCLRVRQSIPIPFVSRFNQAFELIVNSSISQMIPAALIKEFYPDDFLYVLIIPYLSEDEYFNIYELLAFLQLQNVHWCVQLPVDAPYINDLFFNSPKFSISNTFVDFNGSHLPYLTITTYPQNNLSSKNFP